MSAKFILVDDHQNALDELVKAMDFLYPGCEYLTASNGNTAFSIFRENLDTKLILSDIMMPESGGFDLAAKIFKSEHNAPIVFVSGTWSSDYLGKGVLQQILLHTPIGVAQKRFYYYTDDEFYNSLKSAIHEAESKHAQISHIAQRYINALSQLGSKMQQEIDKSLAMYLESRLKEFIGPMTVWADEIKGKSKVLDLLADILRDLPSDVQLTKIQSRDLLHDLNATFMTININLLTIKDRDEIEQLGQERYNALINNLWIYGKLNSYFGHIIFRSEPTKEFKEAYENYSSNEGLQIKPITRNYPQKLYSVDVMAGLLSTVPQYFVLKPNESLDDKMEDYKRLSLSESSMPIIARNASLAEYGYGDAQHPFAGFFKSIGNIRSENKLRSAIKELREDSGDCSQYCTVHSLQQPDENHNFIIIMKDTLYKYEGSLLEHPNLDGRFIFEFWEREFERREGLRRVNYYAVYDADNESFLDIRFPEEISKIGMEDFLQLSKSLVKDYYLLINSGKFDGEKIHQYESGFTKPSEYASYQFRPSLQKTGIADFKISTSKWDIIFRDKSFGITPPEGIEMVVFTGDVSHAGRAVLAEKTFGIKQLEGREVCYIIDSEMDPNNICYAYNVGLIITGKGHAIQSHGYFNAMMHANRVLMLSPSEFNKLGLQRADIIRYTCNGNMASIKRITDYEPVFREINKILNTR